MATAAALPNLETVTLPRVEVFQVGRHRDKVYTVADLDRMVANFARWKGKVDPPVALGHEEEQPLLNGAVEAGLAVEDNSGEPALGWVTRLWREGVGLFAELIKVPAKLAALIKAGALRKVSAEVYDDAADAGIPGVGKMLRRVSLLGKELPQIKTLADLWELYSENPDPDPKAHWPCVLKMVRAQQTRHKTWQCFFEATPMDRATMLDALRQAGWPEDAIAIIDGQFPDDETGNAELGKLVLAVQSGGAAGGGSPGGPPAMAAEFPDGQTRESIIAELVGMGEDQAALEAMTDEELIAMWNEKQAAAPLAETTNGTPAVTVPMEVSPKSVTYKYAELAEQAKKLEAQQKQLAAQLAAQDRLAAQNRKMERTLEAQRRKAMVESFCEQMVKEGRLSPADVEVDKKTGKAVGPVRARLERAPNVAKFSEKSELELQMEEITLRPPRKYGEKLPAGQGGARAELFAEMRKRGAAMSPQATAGKDLHERLHLNKRN